MDDDCIRLTREILQSEGDPLFKKPRLTDALLQRPPFRFLHDIISAIQRKTGFGDGLFSDAESDAKALNREGKISYLKKLIEVLGVEADPAKIVAGLEPERTNAMLQALGRAAKTEKVRMTKPLSERPPSRRHSSERKNQALGQEEASKDDATKLPSTVILKADDGEENLPSAFLPGDFCSQSRSQSSEPSACSLAEAEKQPNLEDNLRAEQEAAFDLDMSSSMNPRPPSRRHPSERPNNTYSFKYTSAPSHSETHPADILKIKNEEETASREDLLFMDFCPPSRIHPFEDASNSPPPVEEKETRPSTVDVLCLDDPSNVNQLSGIPFIERNPRTKSSDSLFVGDFKRERMTEGSRQALLESPSSRCSSRPQTARKPPPSTSTARRPISSRGRSYRPLPTPSLQSSSESEPELETVSWSSPMIPEWEGALVRDLKREIELKGEEQYGVMLSKQDTSTAISHAHSVGSTVERLMSLLDGLRRCLEYLSHASEAAEKERQFWQRERDICREKLNEHATTISTVEDEHMRDLEEEILQSQLRIRCLKDSNHSRDFVIKRMLKSLTECAVQKAYDG